MKCLLTEYDDIQLALRFCGCHVTYGPRRQIDLDMSTGNRDTSVKPEDKKHNPRRITLQTSR